MTAATQTENQAKADGYDDVYFSAPDGLKLHARDYGRANPETFDRFPLICLPGLSRNAADFHDIALKVANDAEAPRRVVSFDYRGRGQSEWAKAPEDYNVVTETEDVLTGMAALGIEHAIFLGTSRGGLIMHVMSAMRPGVIAAGILIYLTDWKMADPLSAALISVLIFFWAFGLVRESTSILLESVPAHMDLDEIREKQHI